MTMIVAHRWDDGFACVGSVFFDVIDSLGFQVFLLIFWSAGTLGLYLFWLMTMIVAHRWDDGFACVGSVSFYVIDSLGFQVFLLIFWSAGTLSLYLFWREHYRLADT
jgi:hypothetical protein